MFLGRSLGALAVIAGLALSGCDDPTFESAGSMEDPTASASSPTETAASSASPSSSTTPTTTPTSAAPTTPEPVPEVPKLTGFGATVEDWEDEHGDWVRPYAEGAVYGPVVRDDVHEYFGVTPGDGRIYSYSRAFPEGTDLALAEQLLLKDFPEDARIAVRDDDDANCLIVLIKSATLHKEIGYHATAAFGTSDSPDLFRKNDVSDAIVSLAFESGPDLGFC